MANKYPHALYYAADHGDNMPDSLYYVLFQRETDIILRIFYHLKEILLKFRETENKKNTK